MSEPTSDRVPTLAKENAMKSMDLKPATVMEHSNGDRVVLKRRKEAGEGHMPGWWLVDGGGLADAVIDEADSDWRVVDD